MIVGLIALAVVFLGTLLVADLCRARTRSILEARADVGQTALGGLLMGSPTFYGGTDSGERIHNDILAVSHDPVQYCYYRPGDYPYITENLAEPLVAPQSTLVGAYGFSLSEKTYYVTNSPLLRELRVGGSTIAVSQQACMPQMRDFP
jgi:hypothetical protein